MSGAIFGVSLSSGVGILQPRPQVEHTLSWVIITKSPADPSADT